mgnify:CR=1 FL=1
MNVQKQQYDGCIAFKLGGTSSYYLLLIDYLLRHIIIFHGLNSLNGRPVDLINVLTPLNDIELDR